MYALLQFQSFSHLASLQKCYKKRKKNSLNRSRWVWKSSKSTSLHPRVASISRRELLVVWVEIFDHWIKSHWWEHPPLELCCQRTVSLATCRLMARAPTSFTRTRRVHETCAQISAELHLLGKCLERWSCSYRLLIDRARNRIKHSLSRLRVDWWYEHHKWFQEVLLLVSLLMKLDSTGSCRKWVDATSGSTVVSSSAPRLRVSAQDERDVF